MSARLFSIALELDVPSPAAKLIIAKMVDCCDDDGRRIFPSVATLARVGQCSDRQVQRYLRKFCGLGLLRVVREGGTGRRCACCGVGRLDGQARGAPRQDSPDDMGVSAGCSAAGWVMVCDVPCLT